MAAAAVDGSPESAKDRYFIVLVVLLLAILACISLPHVVDGGGPARLAREASARAIVSQLHQAGTTYLLDQGTLPSGDGRGSGLIASALGTRDSKKFPYFEFSNEMLDPAGNIRNPVEDGKVFYYRYPGVHNPRGFDLWGEDSRGRPDGINNWGK